MVKAFLVAAFALAILVSATGLPIVRVAVASFMPPLLELPRVYIRSDGAIGPGSAPIRQVEDRYVLTGNI